MSTRTVNLRDLPEEVVRRAKACAALHGLTLKDFVTQAIETAVEKDIPTHSLPGVMFGRIKTKERVRKK